MTANRRCPLDTTAVDTLEVSFDSQDSPDPASAGRRSGRRWRRVPDLALILMVALAALVVTRRAPEGTTTGAAVDHAVLSMANAYASLGYEPAVRDFVNRVAATSAGAMRMEVVDEWGDGDPTDPEREVVEAVRTGAADLGWVGTRVLDTLGVRSFQALTAPMLIDSYAAQQAVFDGGIPDRMLQGLADLSVTGLAVLAGGLRKPIAVTRPLLEPADWQGITFETFHSDGQTEAVRALGAIPMFPSRAGPDGDLDVGGVHALDKNLFIYALNGTTPHAPHVSANVNLRPETAALLVNPHLLSSLGPVQQGWLRRAAADAAAGSTEFANVDASLVGELCRRGTRFAYASETQLAALRRAMAPVYARLAHDPQTSAFIREIEVLKGSIDAETLDVPNGCIGPAPTGSTPPPNAPAALNGVYRVGLFSGDLVSLGMSPADARAAAGTHTLTLKNGRWNRRGIGLENSVECSGTYTVADRRIAFTVDRLPDCDWTYGDPVDAAWTVRGRDLILTDVHGDGLVPLVMGSRPWQRTSEPPSGTELRR